MDAGHPWAGRTNQDLSFPPWPSALGLAYNEVAYAPGLSMANGLSYGKFQYFFYPYYGEIKELVVLKSTSIFHTPFADVAKHYSIQ